MNITLSQGVNLTPQQVINANKAMRQQFTKNQFTGKSNFKSSDIEALKSMKISLDGMIERSKDFGFAMDTTYPTPYQSTVTTPTVSVPIQKLQNWLPGFIQILTAKRTGDDVTGIFLTGSWEDQQVVRGDIEMTGYPNEYDDYSNIPNASYNVNWTTRTVVRFMIGMSVSMLETAQAARMNVNPNQWKMNACAYNLEVIRNTVDWYGYNSGNNQTYGILTDPNLSAWQQVALNADGSSRSWASKTYLEIINDVLTAKQSLDTGAAGNLNIETPMKMAVALSSYVYLEQTTNFPGVSVIKYLKDTFNIEVVACPQLDSAYSSANGFYLFAETIDDDSTDDKRTWIQPIPARLQNLGVRQDVQYYSQGFVMATAGAFLQRPWAVVRYYGI